MRSHIAVSHVPVVDGIPHTMLEVRQASPMRTNYKTTPRHRRVLPVLLAAWSIGCAGCQTFSLSQEEWERQRRGEVVILLMSTPDEQLTVHLSRARSDATAAYVVFGHDPQQARCMRSLFGRHGLETPQDSGMPQHFHAHLPVQVIYPISPLPSDPPAITEIATDLFRDACNLDNKAELHFRYYEVTNAR